MEHRYPVLSVENFGPIARAEVELRPLTVLIGPNNSGKSYLAKLVYALETALSVRGFVTTGRDQWVDQLDSLERSLPRMQFGDAPPEVQDQYRKAAESSSNQHRDWLRWAVSNYFGFGFQNLVNRNVPVKSFGIEYGIKNADGDQLATSISISGEDLAITLQLPSLSKTALPVLGSVPSVDNSAPDVRVFTQSRWVWDELIRLSGLERGSTFYLPSGRSGLVAGAQVIAAAATSIVARQVGLEAIELAPFTGVEGDFVRALTIGVPAGANLLDRPSWTEQLAATLQLLEQLMGGPILIRHVGSGRPILVYQRDGLELPMERSSSMVAEQAGLALWIKAFLRRGDLLIIDEPEAHLHPENQRLMARVLVRLVNAGVRVVCTTHSSLILNQLSNCITAGYLPLGDREGLGFVDVDLLDDKSIAAYLFQPGDRGSVVTPVPIEPTTGIDEDEFIRVAEAIGEETYRLAVRVDQAMAPVHG